MTKYYFPEHEEAYRQIERTGKTIWDELYGRSGFANFSSRDFLGWARDTLQLPPAESTVLEYGCGTGPGACLIAARGYDVDAIDLIPRAIKLARRFAAERGLAVHFQVQDICALAEVPPRKRYDLIVDGYCLQSIVLDDDRAKLFTAVRACLNPGGYYLISTAMYDPDRRYDEPYDETTGIAYSQLTGAARQYRDVDGARSIGNAWYVPHRRHLKPEALAAELQGAGFRVLWQGGNHGGDVICNVDGGGRPSPQRDQK